MTAALILAKASYFAAAVLFILGLKRMASPVTARRGIRQAGLGMLVAVAATFLITGTANLSWMIAGLAIGILPAWFSGRRVAMTDMPQMVAIYNGMGGGSAAAIGFVELLAIGSGHPASRLATTLAVLGLLIGAVSFSGSIVAWAKLDGRLDRRIAVPNQQLVNIAVAGIAVAMALLIAFVPNPLIVVPFVLVALALGVLMTLPIGGADMPVVISLYNALTGLAVAFEGFVLGNEALIIAGTVVGAAGTLLTQMMAKAMNRSIGNVLFGNFGAQGEAAAIEGSMRAVEPGDVAAQLYIADRIVFVPGYGMAVAQAQHKVWELAQRLIAMDKDVRFAIHPVAGRMPGHMNVLLAEAGVPYDLIADMEDINPEFALTDVAIVIGANDVVNPVAKTDPASPIYGMPILDVAEARQAVVIKRGQGTGFAGIENGLFYQDNCQMLYGDGAAAIAALLTELKQIEGSGH